MEPDIFLKATFWAMANPSSLPRSGMIELVEAAGFGKSSPIMQGVMAYPDGLLTTPNEVVKDLLRRAEERAGREPMFAKREQPLRPEAIAQPVGAVRRVTQIVRLGLPMKLGCSVDA
ncbi:hypothetical protein [Acidisphaera sp. L21]|uniref:hypothetical protein n=1 Tax=Acidisphaera sp. L21 TaxID=1641851 RepID=UPI00131D9489|nr:hypothetical protein [Acidisphaera sp. L21]